MSLGRLDPSIAQSTEPSILLTQGPRFKGEATVQYENLIKDILAAYSRSDVRVAYNDLKEMIIVANGHWYNLTQLLKSNPDLEQIAFNQDDLAKYQAFLNRSTSPFLPIEKDILTEDVDEHDMDEATAKRMLEQMQKAFPRLTFAEMSAIRIYTRIFYAPINYLLRGNAANPFPKVEGDTSDDLILSLKRVAKALDIDPDLNNPVFLTALVNEILLHASITASAISKVIQYDTKICFAASYDVLEKNIDQIEGISFVLVPKEEHYTVYLVAYGKIVSQTPEAIHLKELLQKHSDKNPDGIIVTSDEIQKILLSLNSEYSFSLLTMLPEQLKIKLIGILTSKQSINDLMYEPVYRLERVNDFFKNTYLPEVSSKIGTDKSYQFVNGFYSTTASKEALDGFDPREGEILISTLKNHVAFGKNIEKISRSHDEAERLLLHRQQIYYTNYKEDPNEKKFYLEGIPVRSIDGIDPFSYSHERVLFREMLIRLPQTMDKAIQAGHINEMDTIVLNDIIKNYECILDLLENDQASDLVKNDALKLLIRIDSLTSTIKNTFDQYLPSGLSGQWQFLTELIVKLKKELGLPNSLLSYGGHHLLFSQKGVENKGDAKMDADVLADWVLVKSPEDSIDEKKQSRCTIS